MPYRRRRKAEHFFAQQSIELALAAPQVWAHRMTRLMQAGHAPSRRDRQEFHLMGAEKVAAFYESWNAMFVEMFRQSLKLAFIPAFSWWTWPAPGRVPRLRSGRARRAAAIVLSRGLAPVHRRAVANATRLRHRRV